MLERHLGFGMPLPPLTLQMEDFSLNRSPCDSYVFNQDSILQIRDPPRGQNLRGETFGVTNGANEDQALDPQRRDPHLVKGAIPVRMIAASLPCDRSTSNFQSRLQKQQSLHVSVPIPCTDVALVDWQTRLRYTVNPRYKKSDYEQFRFTRSAKRRNPDFLV